MRVVQMAAHVGDQIDVAFVPFPAGDEQPRPFVTVEIRHPQEGILALASADPDLLRRLAAIAGAAADWLDHEQQKETEE